MYYSSHTFQFEILNIWNTWKKAINFVNVLNEKPLYMISLIPKYWIKILISDYKVFYIIVLLTGIKKLSIGENKHSFLKLAISIKNNIKKLWKENFLFYAEHELQSHYKNISAIINSKEQQSLETIGQWLPF